MNITTRPCNVRRAFDIDFEEFPVTTGRVWSSEMGQDCRYEIHSVKNFAYTVTDLMWVDEIHIDLHLDVLARPITDEGESGRLERVQLSPRDLGLGIKMPLTAHIRRMMAEDQAAMRREARATASV